MAVFILIDDNSKGQRETYGASFIDDNLYSSILSHYEHFNANSDLSFLNTAKCLFIHDSLEDFIDGAFDEHSHKAKDNIIDYLDQHKIQYVCFSDGHYSSIGKYDSDNNIVELKKSTFYGRLESFLKEYSITKEIQLHILAYGENYKKEIMTRNVRSLLQKYSTKRPEEIITLADVMPSSSEEPHYLEEIINMAQPKIGIDYDGVLDYIEDNDVTILDFTSKIKQILNSVSRYGKNNYTWE